jgi:hypothetical protein
VIAKLIQKRLIPLEAGLRRFAGLALELEIGNQLSLLKNALLPIGDDAQ